MRRKINVDRRMLLQASAVGSVGAGLLQPNVASPRWGSSYRGAMPPTANKVVALFDLPGTLTEAELLTVNVLSSRNIGATNGDFRLQVIAGAGGVSNVFQCDLGEGLQFSIVAQTLRLELVSFAPSWGTFPTTPIAYDPANGDVQVTAEVVRGGFGRGPSLTFTEQSRRMNPGSGVNITIPPYARQLYIASQAMGQADGLLIGWALRTPANSNVAGNMNIPFQYGGWVPVPAGSNVLRIDNTSAVDYDVTPIWELAL